jgi:uncharacterized membrane protein
MHTENNRGGHPTSRIEALSDGVFAIAMTLLVLDLKIPAGVTPESLSQTLLNMWTQFAAYIVSFLVLAVYWVGHHNQFHWIHRTDRTLLWINILFLMSIAFVPFSASLLASYNETITATLVYGANVICAGIFLYLHWWYASGEKKLILASVTAHAIRITKLRIAAGLLFYFITTVLAFVSTRVSLILFAVLPIFYMFPSKVDKYYTEETV